MGKRIKKKIVIVYTIITQYQFENWSKLFYCFLLQIKYYLIQIVHIMEREKLLSLFFG